jgi:hypothetical protein
MPLEFYCNQDPRKMRSVKGGKFCEECGKHVIDLRRRSDDKIIDFTQAAENSCVIVYEDQLNLIDHIKQSKNRNSGKNKNMLPFAAGLAAITLFSPQLYAQDPVSPSQLEKDAEGKLLPNDQRNVTDTLIKNETAITGEVQFSKGKSRKFEFTLGYYKPVNDSEDVFITVKTFKSSIGGKFSFTLTRDELRQVQQNSFRIICTGKRIYWGDYTFYKTDEKLILTLNNRSTFMGRVAF